jgi:hypothetical protein
MHGFTAPAAKDAAWRKSKNAAGSCSCQLQLASCEAFAGIRHRHVLEIGKEQPKREGHITNAASSPRHEERDLSRVFEFDRRDCQSREQPGIEEISEKNTSPNAGIPLFLRREFQFHYVNVRHLWSVAQRRQFHSINMATSGGFRCWLHS